MKPIYIIIVIVLIALAGGAGFYGGTIYAQSQSQNSTSDFLRQRAAGNGAQANSQGTAGPCGFVGRNFGGGGNRPTGGSGGTGTNGGTGGNGATGGNAQNGQGGNGNFFAQAGNCVARGQVKSVDPSTGTMQVSTPVNVVTVKLVTGQTTISKTDTGSISDIKVGDRVTVFSQETGDNPTASVVQIQGMPGQQ